METKQPLKRRKTDRPDTDYQNPTQQSCQCGWNGTNQQLGIWLRKDQIVSKICPHCGTPTPVQRTLSFQGPLSQMIH